MAARIPASRGDLADMTDWARENFTAYLGMSYTEIRDAVRKTIRDAVAHLTPGMDIRVADYAADTRACRAVAPVLRYVARELIRAELAGAETASATGGPDPMKMKSTMPTAGR